MAKWIGNFPFLLKYTKNLLERFYRFPLWAKSEDKTPVICRRDSTESWKIEKKCRSFGSEITKDPREMARYTSEQPRKALSILC